MQKISPASTLMPQQFRIINASEGFRLEVSVGCLWLARPGDSMDHFLMAGAVMELHERQVLIQSDKQPAALSLMPAQYRLVPLKTKISAWHVPFMAWFKTRQSWVTRSSTEVTGRGLRNHDQSVTHV